MPTISVVTPTFNEQGNVLPLVIRVRAVLEGLRLDYEHIFIDNASTDNTREEICRICATDNRVKAIFNSRNFGPVRSSYYGILSGSGDAVIYLAADLQDPPELIPHYIAKWREGFQVVMAVKPTSRESRLVFFARKFFYRALSAMSDAPLQANATGAGLYDKKVIEALRSLRDPYPYFRGLVCELGFKRATVVFDQPRRTKGKSKANFFGLLDQAILGFVKHSKLPIRAMTVLGFLVSFFSVVISVFYFGLKLAFWNSFSLGVAPLVVGYFFLMGLNFLFLGLIGEYVFMTFTHVKGHPLVTEERRINFCDEA